jgi:conjugal transfer pilus assembly protein TraA
MSPSNRTNFVHYGVTLMKLWHKFTEAFILLTTYCLVVYPAQAADHSGDFQTLYDQLLGWTNGTLGKSISLIFLLVGLGVGCLRGSILGAIACLAAALSLVIAPEIVEAIFA